MVLTFKGHSNRDSGSHPDAGNQDQMRILFYIRMGGDAVAALFGPFSVGVVEPKTPHLGLIKEAALASVAEEFVDELANPVVVPLVHFVHSGADDTPVISPVGF